MFYLKLFPLPDKFPLWGGSYFFPAIFNFADSCITVGIVLAIIFNKRIFNDLDENQDNNVAKEDVEASINENVETFHETSLREEQTSAVINNSNNQIN